MFTADRKSSYKLPPTTIRDKLVSQEARRNKALEEQKRRRAQKVDSARQLDLFAGLTLGASDDEDGDADPSAAPRYPVGVVQEDEAEVEEENAPPAPGSIAQYAAMLSPGYQGSPSPAPDLFSSASQTPAPSTESLPISIPEMNLQNDLRKTEPEPTKSHSSKKKRGGASKQKRRSNKPNKWADRCMYAELLEMSADEPWDRGDGIDGDGHGFDDGLPKDLESAWVAVAPVPAGKRCLAVTHTSAGVSGLVPNTTLRSRLLGKTLLVRFPSVLPPLTVLDCILDKRWRENGIVHVLDVIRWKGQDVGDCEAGFRFWWRDTRLAELAQPTQLKIHDLTSQPGSSSTTFGLGGQISSSSAQKNKYTFPYPTSFIPVPYHTNTTLAALDVQVISAARSWRSFSVPLPTHLRLNAPGEETSTSGPPETGMDVEPVLVPAMPVFYSPPQFTTPAAVLAHIEPDGMLLYVSEASYEPGTSPLSSWIPIHSYDLGLPEEKEKVDADGLADGRAKLPLNGNESTEGSLDLFQRLVKRRLWRAQKRALTEVNMDGGAGAGANAGMDADVDMDI